jgi:hypothetical protein
MKKETTIQFKLNGSAWSGDADPSQTALDFLRNLDSEHQIRLPGRGLWSLHDPSDGQQCAPAC